MACGDGGVKLVMVIVMVMVMVMMMVMVMVMVIMVMVMVMVTSRNSSAEGTHGTVVHTLSSSLYPPTKGNSLISVHSCADIRAQCARAAGKRLRGAISRAFSGLSGLWGFSKGSQHAKASVSSGTHSSVSILDWSS